MRVYIIIITYNGIKWIQKCLESTRPYPVIVVDNNSSDGTYNLIETNFPETILLKQNKNLGFGQANNIGISHALKKGAEFVFLLNQDAYLSENCIRHLLYVYKNNKSYGILSPIHLNGDGTKLDENFSNYVNYSSNPNFYSDYVLSERKVKELYEVPFVNAAGWLISKDCLLRVGGFDPIFFHYGEDDNYCQRVLYHNFKIGVVPEIFILHDREARVATEIKALSDGWLRNKERRCKVEYANPNKNTKFRGLRKETIKNLIFSLLQFKIENMVYYLKEFKLLSSIEQTVEKSRNTNIKEGAHYIS